MSEGTRTFLSLLIVVHFFFVFVALSANFAPSPLQARLLRRFAFYTQLLNFDPNFTPYHLTHASEMDVDHRIEIRTADAEEDDFGVRIPAAAFSGAEHYQRQQRLGRVMAFVAEDDAMAASLAQAIGEYAVNQLGVKPQQVRVRRHLLQDWEAIRNGTAEERDPDSAVYFRTPYAVNCVVLGDGRVQVVRVEEAGQVARPGRASPERVPPQP